MLRTVRGLADPEVRGEEAPQEVSAGGREASHSFKWRPIPRSKNYLDVSAEQSGYLKLLKEESQAEDKKFFDSLRDSDTSREERFQKMQEYRSKQVPEMDKQLKEILGEDKLKRLKEVNLQANGSMALLSPEISKEVGLTEDQKSQLQSTLQETIRESFARFGGGPGGPPGGPGGGPPPGDGPPRGGPGREQFESIRKDLETKFLAVLTDKQKSDGRKCSENQRKSISTSSEKMHGNEDEGASVADLLEIKVMGKLSIP